MSPEQEREFAELHAFIDFYATNVKGIDPASPIHPTIVGQGIVTRFGRSKALEGLRQAVNDSIEELAEVPPESVATLDAALREVGLISLSELRRRYAGAFRRILKRGSIRNDTEHHLVHGIVVDLASSVTDQERSDLQQMLDSFEAQTCKLKPASPR